jgi:hypothetical protein
MVTTGIGVGGITAFVLLQIASHRHNGAGTSNLAQLCAEQVAKELKRLKEDFPDHHVWRARV